MTRSASLCALAALAVLATGCATTSESTAHAPAPASAPGTRMIEQDHAYMQQVEQVARRRGIGVTWVNPPMKRRVRSTN
jgi:ABC-type sugar transport system substrate-binding protein